MKLPPAESWARDGRSRRTGAGTNEARTESARAILASRAVAVATILTLILSAVFFSSFDIMRREFTTTGLPLSVCNCLRILVATALTIILCSGGVLVERLLSVGQWSGQLAVPERVLLRFFLGSGAMIAIMFPIGLLGLYYPLTAVLLGAAFTCFGIQGFAPDIAACGRAVRAWLLCPVTPRVRLGVRWVLTAACGVAVLVFLVTRCLYPGETSNDSYEIYWPYQIATVERHALKPNDLWYMFCSFNGAGINFWSMLVTDLLGVQSVTYLFLLAGSLVVFCVGRRAGLNSEAALGAAWVSLQCFAFTNPHWGAFQSHHIQAAAWLIAVVWCVMVFDASGPECRLQPALAGAWMLAALGLFFPLFLVFLLPMLGLLGVDALTRRDEKGVKGFGVMISAGGAAAISLMCLNYSIVGMPLANPASVMWKFADQARFSKWCSPYNMHYLFEGSAERTTGLSLGALLEKRPQEWVRLLRLESFGVLSDLRLMAVLGVFLLWAALTSRERLLGWLRTTAPLILPLVTCMVITNTSHPDSVYRNYGFVCFFIPVLLFSGWHCAGRCARCSFSPPFASVLLLAVTFSPTQDLGKRFVEYAKRHHPDRASDFIRFAFGRISVEQALIRGDGLWNPVQNARKAVGFDENIFSFNHPPLIASYLFPGPGVLTEPSRCGLSGKWDAIVFGDPDAAKRELQRQRINYFLIDLNCGFFGALPWSPLFQPATLSARFDLVTQLDSSVLLTWKGSGQPIPEFVVDAWNRRVCENRSHTDSDPDSVMSRLYDNTKAIYDFNRGKPLPVRRPPHLGKVKGWQ